MPYTYYLILALHIGGERSLAGLGNAFTVAKHYIFLTVFERVPAELIALNPCHWCQRSLHIGRAVNFHGSYLVVGHCYHNPVVAFNIAGDKWSMLLAVERKRLDFITIAFHRN